MCQKGHGEGSISLLVCSMRIGISHQLDFSHMALLFVHIFPSREIRCHSAFHFSRFEKSHGERLSFGSLFRGGLQIGIWTPRKRITCRLRPFRQLHTVGATTHTVSFLEPLRRTLPRVDTLSEQLQPEEFQAFPAHTPALSR